MTTPPRPDVLALPPSTALRMVVLSVALVIAALFVGTAMHNAVLGESWQTAVQGCLQPGQILPDTAAQTACQSPAERRRAVVALLTASGSVVLAVVVVVAAPVVIRRRRRLEPADGRFARAIAAVAALSAEMGVRPPGLLVGPGSVRSPFCVGRPGDHRIALPRKLALRGNPALFDALVGHELAHLAHRDVGISWLARSLAYVLGPLLAIPVVVAAVGREPGLALDIGWRAALLLGVVLLLVRGLMRAREFDADLRAARRPGVGRVLDVELARRPEESGRRAAVAWHPGPAQRRAVLAEPVGAATLGLLDGLPLGFLALFAVPVVGNTAAALLLGDPSINLVALISALVLGPLLGVTLGIGLWRDALAARSGGRRAGTGRVALGVLGGGLVGQVSGLALVGLDQAASAVIAPVALAGATVLLGGLGEQWVTGVGRTRRPASVWAPAALAGALLVTTVLWATGQLEVAFSGGWGLVAAWLTAPGALALPGVAALVLALAAAWALRRGRDGSTPPWWGGSSSWTALPGRGTILVGLVAGVAGGAGLALHRAVAGASETDADAIARFDAAVLAAAAVGAVVVAVLTLLRGTAGAGAGLLAGPVATTTTAILFLVIVAIVGGNPLAFAVPLVSGALGAGWLLSVAVASLGLTPVPGLRSTAVAALLALLLAGGSATGLMAARSVVAPGLPSDLSHDVGGDTVTPAGRDGSQQAVAPTADVPRSLYADVVARPLLEGRRSTAAWFRELQTESPPADESARRIRAEQLPVLRSMLEGAESVRPSDPMVSSVHGHAVTGARLQLAGFETLAAALETQDRDQLATADALLRQGNAEWRQWAAGVGAL
ncbi:M48 family metalloprotease [Actinomycetospora soli]|uniref:M48 family metalloprotease n=1 Tax=Actinomycetospora soli TaxID=2893887 RepID=UPI001E2F906E|nr:M48 family metalloprotease [Actinomycetospora soli]MCD2190311.1 M48 family metalloprotease [Actinomycetospora soli]